ncbi:hypothetical protein ACLOJK_003877 [Asimina triloba]
MLLQAGENRFPLTPALTSHRSVLHGNEANASYRRGKSGGKEISRMANPLPMQSSVFYYLRCFSDVFGIFSLSYSSLSFEIYESRCRSTIVFVASPKSSAFCPSHVDGFPSRSRCLHIARLQVGSIVPRHRHLLSLLLATTRNHSRRSNKLVTGAYIIVIVIVVSLFARASCWWVNQIISIFPSPPFQNQ